MNLIDVDSTNQLIEKYKQDHSKEIIVNQFRRKEELKGESLSIKEKEEEILAANQKFQVQPATIHVVYVDGILINWLAAFITLIVYALFTIQEDFRSEKAQKLENKRQLNQIMLGVSLPWLHYILFEN